jgi:hypothetical protein
MSWEAEHTALVRRRVASLQAEGFQTFVEDQNELRWQGRTAILVGRPDIIAVSDDRAVVVDCKTGLERTSHWMQVGVYMLMLPRSRSVPGKIISGEVCYGNASCALRPEDLSTELKAHIWNAVRLAASDLAPPTMPAPRECRYCDIKACLDRVEQLSEPGADASDLF